jgi:alpha-mannosidase
MTTPDKFFAFELQRFEVFCREVIDPAVYPATTALDAGVFQCTDPVPFAAAAKAAYTPVKPGFQWGPVWSTAWFRITGRVPASMSGRTVGLRFSTDTEALLWKDGSPHHGLDANRDFVRVFTPARGGEDVLLHVEAACNHLFGDRGLQWDPPEIHRRWNSPTPGLFERCELAVIDETVWRLKWVYSFALQLARDLPHDSARARQLFGALRRATNALPDDRVAEHAPNVLAELEAAVRVQAGGAATLCHAVGHAHIDTAWLWPLRETRRKCLRTFSTVLRNMERHAGYRFLCSQAQQYAYVEQDAPALFAEISKRVAEGRWEPGGSMWVEPDCTVPSAESFVRQILHADRYWRAKFGDQRGRQRFLYLPDTFGFPPILPQIMAQAGIDTFITNKLHWNSHTTFPHTTFRWRGLGGYEVLAHQTPGMDYNATNTPKELRRGEQTHKNKDLSSVPDQVFPPEPPASAGGPPSPTTHPARWLQPFGYGDGGGGPTDWNLLYADLAANADSLPRVRHSSVNAFCDALHADVKAALASDPTAVPRHEGELYLELHRGTYTTHSRLKRSNRDLEDLLRAAEILAFAGPKRLPLEQEREAKADLDRAWKLLLLNQFHDILPGSSITWVYEDAFRDHAEVRRLGQKWFDIGFDAWASALDASGLAEPRAVLNLSSRRGPESLPPYSLAARSGAGASSRAITLTESSGTFTLSGGDLTLDVSTDGRLRLHSSGGSDGVHLEAPAGFLQPALYEDRPRLWDAWDIDEEFAHKPVTAAHDEGTHERVDTPGRPPALRLSRSLGRASRITHTYRLDPDARRVEITVDVDWHEEHRLLKLRVPPSDTAPASHGWFGTQGGFLRREPTGSTAAERGRFEVPFHRFLALPGGSDAQSLTTGVFSPDTFGASFTHAGVEVSLLRAPTYPDAKADRGTHSFRFALAALPGLDDIVREAEAFARPIESRPISLGARAGGQRAVTTIAIDTRAGAPQVECCKPGDRDGELILRVSNPTASRADFTATLGFPFSGLRRVDLLERPIAGDGLRTGGGPRSFAAALGPFEIATFALTRTD